MARGGRRDGAGRKPGSLNKATADIREAAQQYTAQALEVLVEVMTSGEHPAAARVSAASAVLDRAHGKPRQAMDVDLDATVDVKRIERVIVNADH